MSDDHEHEVTELVDGEDHATSDEAGEDGDASTEPEAPQEEVVDLGASVEKYQVVQEMVFEELHLPPDISAEVQNGWQTFLTSSSSREAAGETIYAALFDAAPSLQSLFKTARSVMAMRFMNGELHHQPLSRPSRTEDTGRVLGFPTLGSGSDSASSGHFPGGHPRGLGVGTGLPLHIQEQSWPSGRAELCRWSLHLHSSRICWKDSNPFEELGDS
eukprot:Skav228292  [mRNA]  locus=scaffold209:80370:94245:- [translate_table: standard]